MVWYLNIELMDHFLQTARSSSIDLPAAVSPKTKNPKKDDGKLLKMTTAYFAKHFMSLSFTDQQRGHLQEGQSGNFAPNHLSWRSMLRRGFRDVIVSPQMKFWGYYGFARKPPRPPRPP